MSVQVHPQTQRMKTLISVVPLNSISQSPKRNNQPEQSWLGLGVR